MSKKGKLNFRKSKVIMNALHDCNSVRFGVQESPPGRVFWYFRNITYTYVCTNELIFFSYLPTIVHLPNYISRYQVPNICYMYLPKLI